jgi:hypothetical protein
LLVDVDDPPRGRLKLGPIFSTLHICGLGVRWIRYDRTRKGWHIVYRLRGVSLERPETIALQLLLGSDRRREGLNLMRHFGLKNRGYTSQFWKARWNILYSEKLKTGPAVRA